MKRFIAIDHRHCTGCKTCEVVCSLYHFGECNPCKSAIRVVRKEQNGLVLCLPLVCQQCEPAPCIEACPTGALSRDEDQGKLTLDREECSTCELCVEACLAGCISIETDGNIVVYCDLCGGQPQCVPFCHAHCLAEAVSSETTGKQDVEHLARIVEQEGLSKSILARRAR